MVFCWASATGLRNRPPWHLSECSRGGYGEKDKERRSIRPSGWWQAAPSAQPSR